MPVEAVTFSTIHFLPAKKNLLKQGFYLNHKEVIRGLAMAGEKMSEGYRVDQSMLVEASIVRRFNRTALLAMYAAQAAVVTGGAAFYGTKGAAIGIGANLLDFALRRPSSFHKWHQARQGFIEKHWEAIKVTPQFQWLTNELESGAGPLNNDGSVRLLDVGRWPEKIRKELLFTSVAAGARYTVLGRVYDGLKVTALKLKNPLP